MKNLLSLFVWTFAIGIASGQTVVEQTIEIQLKESLGFSVIRGEQIQLKLGAENGSDPTGASQVYSKGAVFFVNSTTQWQINMRTGQQSGPNQSASTGVELKESVFGAHIAVESAEQLVTVGEPGIDPEGERESLSVAYRLDPLATKAPVGSEMRVIFTVALQ